MIDNKKSLYRTYRPSTFESLAGHKNVVDILVKQLRENKISHDLLFAGQHGTGKTSVARIFAKSVNCTNLIDGFCCEKCENCLSANNNAAPDIFEIDAASNNGVDEIRGIKNNVATLPVLGKYKVYIIDEVHMLTKGAFNALLKTLEEPPVHALFILATTEYAKISATIVSRCQTFNFQKIDKESLKNRLKFICSEENYQISEEVLDEIFYLSEGSLRDALNILEQLMIVNDSTIDIKSLKSIFYIATKQEKLSIIESIIEGNTEAVINYFETADSQGMDFDVFSLSLIEIIKEIIEYKLTNNLDFLRVLEKDDLKVVEQATTETMFKLADNLSEAYAKTKGTTINFNYLLISLLKAVTVEDSPKKGNIIEKTTELKVDVEEKVTAEKETVNSYNSDYKKTETKVKEKVEAEEKAHVEAKVVEKLVETEQTYHQETTPQNNPVVEEELIKESKPEKPTSEVVILSELANLQSLEMLKSSNQETHVVELTSVMNLLVGAKKEFRDMIDKKIKNWFEVDNNNKLVDPKKAAMFYPLYNVIISAASEQEVLIKCDDFAQAKLICLKLENKDFREAIFKEFEREFVIYPIDANKWEDLKIEFKNLKVKNMLPTYKEIDIAKYYDSLAKTKLEKTLNNDLIESAAKIFDLEEIEIGE